MKFLLDNAIAEGEATAVALEKSGAVGNLERLLTSVVDSILSDDSDVIPLGSENIFCNLNISNRHILRIDGKRVLAGLKLTLPEVHTFAMLLI
jgi:hypothetical protein